MVNNPALELFGHLNDLAHEQGWEKGWDDPPWDYYYYDDIDRLLTVRLMALTVELDLGLLRKHGLDEEADELRALTAKITGGRQKRTKLRLKAPALLAHWDYFAGELLPQFMISRLKTSQCGVCGGPLSARVARIQLKGLRTLTVCWTCIESRRLPG